MAKQDEILENILREVEISNFFSVIFMGLLLLVILVVVANLNLVSSTMTSLVGVVVLISFLIYLVDFVKVKKFRRLHNRK
ncbi:MAG: hypothetical protein KGH53_03035 [Candidatus Micrarchaeota archaeon]|nr:hypothetical protein [Candidatus Micrarchaeota archaeon]